MQTLEQDSSSSRTQQFHGSDKFPAMLFKKGNKNKQSYKLQIKEESVKLLGIRINEKINFDEHISSLCKKTSMKLNALNRSGKEVEKLIKSFVHSNFNYSTSLTLKLTQPQAKLKSTTATNLQNNIRKMLQVFDENKTREGSY